MYIVNDVLTANHIEGFGVHITDAGMAVYPVSIRSSLCHRCRPSCPEN